METLSKRRKVDTVVRVVQEEQSSSCLSTCVFGVFTFQCSRNKIFISTVRRSWWTVQERVSTADYREDKWGAGRFEETTVSFYSAVKAGYLMEVKEPEFSKPNFEPGEFEEVLSESCEENTADMSTSVRLTVLYQLDNMCLRPSAVGRRGRRGLWFQWEFPHIHIFNTRLFQFEMKNVESVLCKTELAQFIQLFCKVMGFLHN